MRSAVAALPLFFVLGSCVAAWAQNNGAQKPTAQVDSTTLDPAIREHLVEPPHVTCVTQDYKGPFTTARYVNSCTVPYRVTVVFGNIDDRSDFELAPGKNRSNGLTIVDYNNRKGSNWYVCPKGYTAVDMTGKPFKRLVDSYLCRELGF